MPIITRTTRRRYPGAITKIEDLKAFECVCHPTIQRLARRIEGHEDPWRHATIIGGKIYTNMPYWEVNGICQECIP